MEKGFRKAPQAQPHPSHIRNQRANHPQKGSTIAAGPIRNPNDIEAIEQLLDSKPRDYLLFVMGINCGLRVGDMLKLKAGLFRNVREGGKILLREEKTGKYRKVVINKPIKKALERYFAQFKPDDEQPLFKSQRGEFPICVSVVNAMVKSWCKKIGLNGNYGSSTLRKTYGYSMYREHRTNMEMISKLLYHDSPADTRLYLGIQDDEVYDDDVPMKYTIGGGKEGRAMKEQWENDPIIQVISRKSEDQGIIHAYQDGRMSSDIRDAMEKAFRDYIRSEEWKAVTKEVIKRYKGVCQGCGTTEKNGKVVWYAHHKDYLHFGKANDEEIADCTLYCKRCHNKRHSSSDMKGKVPFWAQRKYKREYM